MRKLLLSACVLTTLGGCISSIDGAYDRHARRECDSETTPRERGECHDRVDQNRRDRD